jgi:hypothetical protein
MPDSLHTPRARRQGHGPSNDRWTLVIFGVGTIALTCATVWLSHVLMRALGTEPPPASSLTERPPDPSATLLSALAVAAFGVLLLWPGWRLMTPWRGIRSAGSGSMRNVGIGFTLAACGCFALAAWLTLVGTGRLRLPQRTPTKWDGCNWVLSGLAVSMGVVALQAGFSEWRECRRASTTPRDRVQPWHLLVFAMGCFAAAIVLYMGSCLEPEGSS